MKTDAENVLATYSCNKVEKVVVHPLVLLSAVDHFIRVTKGSSRRRVVGALLGSVYNNGRVLDITNSFAVPFDEDKDVWFLDQDYLEYMWQMFRKINAKEQIVGWYHTGPKLRPNDVAIGELFKKYYPNAVLVIIDSTPSVYDKIPTVRDETVDKYVGAPVDAYVLTEEVHEDGTPSAKTFDHVHSEIDAEEAEDVGVEHLLRDIQSTGLGSLSQRITNQVSAIRGFHESLGQMLVYLDGVINGRLPKNQRVLYHLQDVLNLLSRLSHAESTLQFPVLNDQMAVIYIAMICRTVVALHDLINNKIQNRQSERNAAIAAAAAQAAATAASQQATTGRASGSGGNGPTIA